MNYNEIFYLVFLGQIVLISAIIPRWFYRRIKHMMSVYKPAEYPKLYPVSTTQIDKYTYGFLMSHALIGIIGLMILIHSVITQSKELLNWDTQSVLTLYFMIQQIPFWILAKAGFKYYRLMREKHFNKHKKASLKPRYLSDFISASTLGIAVISFLAYVTVIIYIQQDPFPGFVGYWNILFVGLLNGFFLLMTYVFIRGKKSDPHQSHQDRINLIKLSVQILMIGLIACNIFLTTNLILASLELRHIGDLIQSLYFSFIALVMSQTSTYEPLDYSVYQNQAKLSE